VSNISKHTRNQVLAKYGHKCAACQSAGFLEIDHRRPRWAGGADDLTNLWPLCQPCHRSKNADEMHARNERAMSGWPQGWPA
jgi:5-methylcytosine-specific restriction endonuclease McrA